jgi:hypothetical protein
MVKVKCPICLQKVVPLLYNKEGAFLGEHDDGTRRGRICQAKGFIRELEEIIGG